MKIRHVGTADIFKGVDSRSARACCPGFLHRRAARKLDALNEAHALDDLKVPSGNRLHALSGDRRDQYAIRINDQYRVCFRWVEGEAIDVEIVDYH